MRISSPIERGQTTLYKTEETAGEANESTGVELIAVRQRVRLICITVGTGRAVHLNQLTDLAPFASFCLSVKATGN